MRVCLSELFVVALLFTIKLLCPCGVDSNNTASIMLVLELDKKPTTAPVTDSVITRYLVAVVSAWCAEVVTYPFDLAKMRLQIQSESAAAKQGFKMEHKGLIATTLAIASQEGPLKLWSGLLPMCQRHAIYAGCRLVSYEHMRTWFADDNHKMTLGATAICGMTCGVVAQLFACPADVVKIQMQAEGRRVLQGKPPRFSGCMEVYKMIYKQSGILGFWRGAIPNMQRAGLVNLGDLAAYDYSKNFFKKEFDMTDGILLHTLSAFVAGFIAAVMGTPADVLKTRLMNQPVGPDGKGTLYKGMIDCLRQSVQNEGIMVIYKGFVPIWVRLAPWALVNWIAFENILKALGGKSF